MKKNQFIHLVTQDYSRVTARSLPILHS